MTTTMLNDEVMGAAEQEAVEALVEAGLLDELMERVDAGQLQLTGEGGFLPGLIKAVLEAQFVPGDWRSFRVLLYDDGLGARDRGVLDNPPDPASQFPDIPPEPPSTFVGIWTHEGSRSMTTLTISDVTVDSRPTMVVAVFIAGENETTEAGELIYYRFRPWPRGGTPRHHRGAPTTPYTPRPACGTHFWRITPLEPPLLARCVANSTEVCTARSETCRGQVV